MRYSLVFADRSFKVEYGYVINRKGLNDDTVGRWEFTIGMFM